jgi:hypothetical protein
MYEQQVDNVRPRGIGRAAGRSPPAPRRRARSRSGRSNATPAAAAAAAAAIAAIAAISSPLAANLVARSEVDAFAVTFLPSHDYASLKTLADPVEYSHELFMHLAPMAAAQFVHLAITTWLRLSGSHAPPAQSIVRAVAPKIVFSKPPHLASGVSATTCLRA